MNSIPRQIGRTSVELMVVTSIIGRAQGFVAEYDGVINPYQGCSFGCDYCYAANFTQTAAEQDNWGRWVRVKENAVDQLVRVPLGRLNGKTYYMATVTDPYQPVEKMVGLTRDLLEVMCLQQPLIRLVVQTRSPLVTRDLDLLHRLTAQGGRVQVNLTVTTDDDTVRRHYEPGCPSIPARLNAIKAVQDSGIQSCITLTPLLPITDPDGFVDTLLATGVRRFIVQGFQLRNQGQGRYVAKTDAKALAATAGHYGCGETEGIVRYQADYRRNLAVLRQALPHLGEGQAGFAPPF